MLNRDEIKNCQQRTNQSLDQMTVQSVQVSVEDVHACICKWCTCMYRKCKSLYSKHLALDMCSVL